MLWPSGQRRVLHERDCFNGLKANPHLSRMDDQDLIELKQLTVSLGSRWVHFKVQAVARFFNETSRRGLIVEVYTHMHELTLMARLCFSMSALL